MKFFATTSVIILLNEYIESENICEELQPNGLFDGFYTYHYRTGRFLYKSEPVMYKNGFKWKYYLEESNDNKFQITVDPKVAFKYDKKYRMLSSHKRFVRSNFLHNVYYLYECRFRVTDSGNHVYCEENVKLKDNNINSYYFNVINLDNTISFNPSTQNPDHMNTCFMTQIYNESNGSYERNFSIYNTWTAGKIDERDQSPPSFLYQIDASLYINGIVFTQLGSGDTGHTIFFNINGVLKFCFHRSNDNLSSDCKPENLKTYLDECKFNTRETEKTTKITTKKTTRMTKTMAKTLPTLTTTERLPETKSSNRTIVLIVFIIVFLILAISFVAFLTKLRNKFRRTGLQSNLTIGSTVSTTTEESNSRSTKSLSEKSLKHPQKRSSLKRSRYKTDTTVEY